MFQSGMTPAWSNAWCTEPGTLAGTGAISGMQGMACSSVRPMAQEVGEYPASDQSR